MPFGCGACNRQLRPDDPRRVTFATLAELKAHRVTHMPKRQPKTSLMQHTCSTCGEVVPSSQWVAHLESLEHRRRFAQANGTEVRDFGSSTWRNLRTECLARDGRRCRWRLDDGERCPATTDLQCAHIDQGHIDQLERVITLCGEHHRQYDLGKRPTHSGLA